MNSHRKMMFCTISDISEGDFHGVANDTLERLAMAFEELEPEVGDDFDLNPIGRSHPQAVLSATSCQA